MSTKVVLFLFVLASCASNPLSVKVEPLPVKEAVKEFAPGEVILATQLLTKIFDREMAPLACVSDTDEASLLLRTLRPRMEVVQDDMEAMLDNPKDVELLISNCDKNCTCGFVDDLLREHLVVLPKAQKKMLDKKKNDKELNRCLNYEQSTFCQGELYRQLETEKADFSFEEAL